MVDIIVLCKNLIFIVWDRSYSSTTYFVFLWWVAYPSRDAVISRWYINSLDVILIDKPPLIGWNTLCKK